MDTILVTGATGQIGTELTAALRARHGAARVIASARQPPAADTSLGDGPFELVDVTRPEQVREAIARHRVTIVYHLAAVLSATAERHPAQAWSVNLDGLRYVLEAARNGGVRQLFWPSSIAAFGPDTPLDGTPQDTVMRPTTVYGIAKVAGELLCDYHVHRYGLDVRGIRYPGVISSETAPGGGTTDYAVAIFHGALDAGRYTCFVREDTVLPMVYMPDCIRAALDLMAAPRAALTHHNGFNLAAMSFSVGALADEIATQVPGFVCEYAPDERQAIADSWPRTIDDSAARREWGWAPEFGLAEMTRDMIARLRARRGS